MSQPVGVQYKTRIPSFSDDASIVEALKVYHYGVDDYTTQPIPDDSIEGNFRTLNTAILNVAAQVTPQNYVQVVSQTATPNIITAQSTTTVPITIRAISSQTSPLQQWQNNSSVNVGSVSTGGFMNLSGYITVGSTTQATTTGISIILANSAHRGITVRGQSGQTANLQEWQNNSGTALASVSSSGNISAPIISASTSLSAPTISVNGDQQLDSFRVRNSYVSTSQPTGGSDGDTWFIYEA